LVSNISANGLNRTRFVDTRNHSGYSIQLSSNAYPQARHRPNPQPNTHLYQLTAPSFPRLETRYRHIPCQTPRRSTRHQPRGVHPFSLSSSSGSKTSSGSRAHILRAKRMIVMFGQSRSTRRA
jgi:hypothetical protein